MKNLKIKKYLIHLLTVLALFPFPSMAMSFQGMKSMDDGALRSVTGQGLIVSDHIDGSDFGGSTNPYANPFDFYRIGMDGELELNLNISKLQLGCGGINDHLSGHSGCDIDIDYASLMGSSGTNPGAPGSAFKLLRPYIEFAIKNDDNPTLREVAGIKIGGQSADGAISAGRRYTVDNAQNMENTAFGTSCDTDAFTGSGVVGCHSGINSVSGFLGAELSISMDVRARIAIAGVPLPIVLNATGCTGRTQRADDACGESQSDALFVDLAGTRMQTLGLRAAKLSMNNSETDFLGGDCGLLNPIACLVDFAVEDILQDVNASLNTDLRSVHKLTFDNTSDFFLSFQREVIAYPRYSKQSAYQDFVDSGQSLTSIMDVCATSGRPARCNSAYAVPANTGWWLNAPSVKLLDVNNTNADLGNVSVAEAISLLAAPGLLIENPEFNLTPAKNCYGSSTFC